MTVPQPSVPGLSPETPEYAAARRAALRDYFLSNADRFTSEALGQAALDAGYTRDEVDAAFGAARDRVGRPWSSTVLLTAGVVTLVAWSATGLSTDPASPMSTPTVVAAVVMIAVLGWFVTRDRRPEIARGIAVGIVGAIVVPVALIAAITGICVAIATGIGWSLAQ